MTDKYRSNPAVNWSTLKSLRKSPKHYQHELGRVWVDTSAVLVGLGAEMMRLEPEKVEESIVIYPGKVRRGKAWDAFKEENSGRLILSESEHTRAVGCAEALAKDKLAVNLTDHPDALIQSPIYWKDHDTGIKCKGRPDVVLPDRLVDIKTCYTVEPHKFCRHATEMGYYGQLAFYSDGLNAVGHRGMQPPVLVVVESNPPHDVVCFELSPDIDSLVSPIEEGRKLYKELLAELKDCQQKHAWPGVARGEMVQFKLPSWAAPSPDAAKLESVLDSMEVEL